jgi:hypothetical protein
MKKSITAVSVLVLLSLLLGACNLTPATPTQVPADQINTIAAMTVQALTTQMAPLPATATNTPEPATATPAVTDTPTLLIPTLNLTPASLTTNTLIPLPTTAGSGNSYSVFFNSDVTIKDGTCIVAGAEFTKTWSITNNGTAIWTTAFMASAFANDPSTPIINGDGSIKVTSPVYPGGVWKYSAQLIAPKVAGTYTQSWKMQDEAGNWFGIGGPNGTPWTVVIDVAKDCSGSDTTYKISASSLNASSSGGHLYADGSLTTSKDGDVSRIKLNMISGSDVIKSVTAMADYGASKGVAQSFSGVDIGSCTVGSSYKVQLTVGTPGFKATSAAITCE